MFLKSFHFLKFCVFVALVISNAGNSYAQQRVIDSSKSLQAKRLEGTLKIDGVPDDEAWLTAPLATNFIESKPSPNTPEAYETRTEVRILYDDYNIYVSGHCYEKGKEFVQTELVGRDQIGTNDFVGVIFDTYYDKINASGFYVTALGEQFDAKYSNTNGEDESWNSVWISESRLVDDGWTFEMRIPYAALRFSKDGTVWGLNILRRRNKTGQDLFWNPIQPTVNGFINQEGTWEGISNIKPPLRLSFSPYFSTYANHYPYNEAAVQNTTASVNGGMDVKYGIDQNFTLDMTLVPDFGQVQSDRRVDNLGPFEVIYNENRSFFTEGVELFNKGDLFYSRRIGGEPIRKGGAGSNLATNETVIKSPSETKLLNATKISGRNKKGLGLGFFNAVTKPMYATIENDITKERRKEQVSTLTNYNIIVADQTLKNNSSVSLINTSVVRSGSDYDANVSAGLFTLNDKSNNYNLDGKFSVSNLFASEKTITGYQHELSFSKNNGRFNYELGQELTNDKYDINDLGVLFNNDYLDHSVYMGYKWIKPTKLFNNLFLNFYNEVSQRYTDKAFQRFSNNLSFNSQLKNLWKVGAGLGVNSGGKDFYEPREAGKFFQTGSGMQFSSFVSSNRAKKFFADLAVRGSKSDLLNGKTLYIGSGQRYRFNNKFSLGTNFTVNTQRNNLGFVDKDTATKEIIFSKRKRVTSINDLDIKYSFTNKMGITLNARHYWSQVKVNGFYSLQDDGTLKENNTYAKNQNRNINLFNVDMVYTWQFAPGSFINVVWKNAITDFGRDVASGYFKNFGNTFETRQNNNISLKIVYFLDYLDFKKRFAKG